MARNATEADKVNRCCRCSSRQGIDEDLYEFEGETSHRVFEYLSDEVASEVVCGACLREAVVHTDGDDPFPVSVYRAGRPETREVFSEYLL